MKPFIVFFGPEGAGKTTQISLLVRKLNAKYGFGNVEVVSIRDNHLLIPMVVAVLKRLNLVTYVKYGDEVVTVSDVSRVVRDKRIWAFFQLLNLLPVYFVRYYLKRKLWGKLVVADRFIPDTLSTLAHFMNNPNILKTRIARLYLKLIPRNVCSIFLFAPYKVLEARYRERKTPNEPEDLIGYEISVGRMLTRVLPIEVLSIDTAARTVVDTSRFIEEYLKENGAL